MSTPTVKNTTSLYHYLQKTVVATAEGELGLVVKGPDGDADGRQTCDENVVHFVVFPTTEAKGPAAPSIDKIRLMKAPITNLCFIQSEVPIPTEIRSLFRPLEDLSKVAQSRIRYHRSLITGNMLSSRLGTESRRTTVLSSDEFHSTHVERSTTSGGMSVILSPPPADITSLHLRQTSQNFHPGEHTPQRTKSVPLERLITWRAVVGPGQTRVKAFPDELYKMQILKP